MTRRLRFAAALLALLAFSARGERRVLVCADPAASPEPRAAADALAARGAPLLRALAATQGAGTPERAAAPEAEPADRGAWRAQGLDHIVLLGTPEEGAAAARTAGTTYGIDARRKELFRLGLGRFRGDAGFVETRMNPWLWSDRFDDNPFSTVLVRIGGTTPRGVALAAETFAAGMNNGVVLGPGARRIETSILDRDPSADPPPALPEAVGDLVFAGWSQPTEAEARAFLDWGATAQPVALWRAKYLATGALETGSGAAWTLGPSALAWGNAALLARFADPADPGRVLAALRSAPGAKESAAPPVLRSSPVTRRSLLVLPMPADENNPALPGDVAVWAQGPWVVLSTLPAAANDALSAALPTP